MEKAKTKGKRRALRACSRCVESAFALSLACQKEPSTYVVLSLVCVLGFVVG
jgi:hypothetical protein